MVVDKNNNVGDTIPLYDEVKRTIYINFNEMSYAYAELMTCSKSQSKLALWDFRKRFIKFYLQINHANKLNKISADKRKYLRNSYYGVDIMNKTRASKIVHISRELIEVLGITKIEGRKRDDWAL